jgi:thiamine-phosphate pyrophosphorylase
MLPRLSTAAAALTAKTRARGVPWLWIMSDMDRLSDPSRIISRLPPGAGMIVRHPDITQRRDLLARTLAKRRSHRVKVLISGDWRAALMADGVHVPEAENMSAGLRLWRKAKKRLLTTSAHGWAGVRRARRMKADVVFLSPVLPTRSHMERKPLGRLMFATLARASCVPVAALGGINFKTLPALNGSRLGAVAGVGFAEKF